MALIPVRPLYSASATATNGSDIIQVTGNVDCSFMSSGSIVSLGTRQLTDAISGTAPDLSGNSTIKLRRPWSDPTTTGPLLAFMSREGLADAVARLRQIIDAQEGALEGAFSYMGSWDASSGNFPPAPGEGLGSQMYRVSVAGTMGGRDYRVGEPLYYDQFTSQWRSFFELATAFSTNLLLQANAAAWRTALGLGTAATATVTTSATDTTPGRLLKVGDFGLGGASPIFSGDLTSLNHTQFVSCVPPTTGGPVGVNIDGAKVLHLRWVDNSATQILYTYNGSTYERNITGGIPLPWRKNYKEDNILGPVTQFGGTPTGAIIQRGSNAIGEFVRFADGTQICTFIRSASLGMSPFAGTGLFVGSFIWQFPALFVNQPIVVGSGADSIGLGWMSCQDTSPSQATVNYFAPNSSNSGTFNIVAAIGRWF